MQYSPSVILSEAKDPQTMNYVQTPKTFFVYILTNKHNTVLYTGFTSNLDLRIYQHTHKVFPGFTSFYNAHTLIWYETFSNPTDGIAAEKRIKGWKREKKIALIRTKNPEFRDLREEADDNTPEGHA